MTELHEGVCASPGESAPSDAQSRVERTGRHVVSLSGRGKSLNLISGFTCRCRHALAPSYSQFLNLEKLSRLTLEIKLRFIDQNACVCF